MIMKYVKPVARNLGDLPVAIGACSSGAVVNQNCNGGYTNVGPCTSGTTAGQGCNIGDSPTAYAPCTSGSGATNCSTGTFAGIS